MPVRARVLSLLAVATVLVVAILREVQPEIITVLSAALASLAPAVLSRSSGSGCDRGHG